MKMIILAAGLGTRMRESMGLKPKILADLGGETILDRLLALADELRLDPMIVTRPEFAADFRDVPAEVLVEEQPVGMLTTLYQTRAVIRHMDEPFVWVGGDVVFTEHECLRGIVEGHRSEDFASYLVCPTDRFKAKVRFEPELAFALTRDGGWPMSCPAFGVQSPRVFFYLERNLESDFVTPAMQAGETVAFREYLPRIFEIDTPLHLAEARDHFARSDRWESRASIS
jgi:molybdopterin-guanine dinucleotide biosynthesis protein A